MFINLLLLHYLRAHTELASSEMEFEMLRLMTAKSDLPNERFSEVSEGDGKGREDKRSGDDDDDQTWRVDSLDSRKSGPLLSQDGKVRSISLIPIP